MRLAGPLYECLPLLYGMVGLLLLYGSYRLHSGGLSILLLVVGILAVIAAVAIWLRRRDFRTATIEYGSRADASSPEDEPLP